MNPVALNACRQRPGLGAVPHVKLEKFSGRGGLPFYTSRDDQRKPRLLAAAFLLFKCCSHASPIAFVKFTIWFLSAVQNIFIFYQQFCLPYLSILIIV